MLRTIEKGSDIKQFLKQCTSLNVPCVTVLFYRNSARIIGNLSSVRTDPDKEIKDILYSSVIAIIEKYKEHIATSTRNPNIGWHTDINMKLPAAYQFAQELDRLMHYIAGIEYIEKEQEDGYPLVHPIEIKKHTVKIMCPYCGMTHIHGILSLGGHAERHCRVLTEDNNGYIIKEKPENAEGRV